VPVPMSVHHHPRTSNDDRQAFEQAASLAAHELIGPLSTATAAVELLRARLDTGDVVVSDLIATTARQLRMAQLQASRLGQLAAGPRTPAPVPTDLDVLAREVIHDLALSELAHHRTEVISEGTAVAVVDPDLVRQVLYNLLSNAANYSPHGRTIVVEVTKDTQRIMLRVRDQGQGVAPEAVARIFEPYQRGHDDAPGLGMGLAISRDIARRHGGDLTLDLEPASQGGAVFLLTLPRHAPSSPSHPA
jgi:signal transduction histidine kinase